MAMTEDRVTASKLLTGVPAPQLEVQTLGGQTWRLADSQPENYTLLAFYRGLHCPLCQEQLVGLEKNLGEFAKLGIEVLAISGDSLERARQSQQDWSLQSLQIGYGLSVEDMRAWGLYLSKGAFDNEPPLFNEPAIFLVKPCGEIALAIISTTPFARPRWEDFISGVKYILENNYPTRGTEA